MNKRKLPNYDQLFHKLSLPAQDFQHIDWNSQIKSLGISRSGHQGVIFVQSASGSIVLKASSYVSQDIFLNKLAASLGVSVPNIRAVNSKDQQFKTLMRAVQRFCYKDDSQYQIVFRRLNRPYCQLMEYVRGISLSSIGPIRFESIFCREANLVQLGKILAFDILVNNYDRIPLYWQNDGNIDNIIFCFQPTPTATWQSITENRDLLTQCKFTHIVAIDPQHTVVNLQQKVAKQNFNKITANIKGFLSRLFNYLKQVLHPEEAPQTDLTIVCEYDNMNKLFSMFCSSVFDQHQLIAISKGLLQALDKFINEIGAQGIATLKHQLRKESGLWEDSYWNNGLDKMHESYFSEITKLLKALWTVHEQIIKQVLQYNYVSNNQVFQEDTDVLGPDRQPSIAMAPQIRIQDRSLPQHNMQKVDNQSIPGSIVSLKPQSLKEKPQSISNKSQKPSQKPKQPSQKQLPKKQPSMIMDNEVSKRSLPKSDKKSLQKRSQSKQKKLNVSKLEQKLKNLRQKNHN